MRFETWIGTGGMCILLMAYLLNQWGKMFAGLRSYNALNAVGAAMLTFYAVRLGSIPFVALEGVWAVSAAWKLLTGGKVRG